MSKFWTQLMHCSGVDLKHSSSYHPETDGQSEVVNRGLEQYLRAYTHSQPHHWYTFLAWAEFWYNSSYHCSNKMSPYEAVYGVKPNLLPSYSTGEASVDTVDSLLQRRKDIQQQLQTILLAQKQMKKQADLNRKDKTFHVGEWVWLKLHHYKQLSVAKWLNFKISRRYTPCSMFQH